MNNKDNLVFIKENIPLKKPICFTNIKIYKSIANNNLNSYSFEILTLDPFNRISKFTNTLRVLLEKCLQEEGIKILPFIKRDFIEKIILECDREAIFKLTSTSTLNLESENESPNDVLNNVGKIIKQAIYTKEEILKYFKNQKEFEEETHYYLI